MRTHSNHYSIRKTNISTLSDHKSQKPFTATDITMQASSPLGHNNEQQNQTINQLKSQIHSLNQDNQSLKTQLAKFHSIMYKQDQIISLDYNQINEETIANHKIKRHLLERQEFINELQNEIQKYKKLSRVTLNQELQIELQQYKAEAKKLKDTLSSLSSVFIKPFQETQQEKINSLISLTESLHSKVYQLQLQKDEIEDGYKFKINKLYKQLDQYKQRIEFLTKRNIDMECKQQHKEQMPIQIADKMNDSYQIKDQKETKDIKLIDESNVSKFLQTEMKKKENQSITFETFDDSVQFRNARIQTENAQPTPKNRYISPPIPFYKLTHYQSPKNLQALQNTRSLVTFQQIQSIGTTLKYQLINLKIEFNQLEKYLFKENDGSGRSNGIQISKALKQHPFNLKNEKDITLVCRYLIEDENQKETFNMELTQDNIVIRSVLRKVIGEYYVSFDHEQIKTVLAKIKKLDVGLRNLFKQTARNNEYLSLEQIVKCLSDVEIHLTRQQLDYILSKIITESIDLNNLKYEAIFKLI